MAGPATVSNWRSRLQGFPPPKAGGKFDLVEVIEWMRDHGPRSTDVRDISVKGVWPYFVAAYQDSASTPPPASRATMVALILLRHVTVTGQVRTQGGLDWQALVNTVLQPNHADAPLWVPFADTLRLLAGDVEAADPRLRGLLLEPLTVRDDDALHLMDLVDLLDCTETDLDEQLLEVVLRLDPERSLSVRSSGRRLAALAVALARLQPGHTLFDPAAGEGTVLTRAWRTHGPSVRLVGQDSDPAVWSTLRSRLLISGVPADLGERPADSLRDDQHPSVRADAVVIDPPLGDSAPALDRWVEYGLSHLAPEGRVVMVLPMHEFVPVRSVRRRPSERMRKMFDRLLAEQLVEGIMVMPSRLRADILGPSLLVALRPDSGDTVTIASSHPEANSVWEGQAMSAMAEVVGRSGLAAVGDSVPGMLVEVTPVHRVSKTLERIAATKARPDKSEAAGFRAEPHELASIDLIEAALPMAPPSRMMSAIRMAPPPRRAALPSRSFAPESPPSPVEGPSPVEELSQRLKELSRESVTRSRELTQLRDQHTLLRAAVLELLRRIEHHRSDIDAAVYRELMYDIDRVRDELR